MNNKRKVCITCNTTKNIENFYFRKDTKKYRNICKECDKKRINEWQNINIKRVKQYKKTWQNANKEYSKKYRIENLDILRYNEKEYYEKIRQKYPRKQKFIEKTIKIK